MRYHTILIDPPWPEYGAGKSKRGADRHYKLMSVAEIRQFLIDFLVYDRRIGMPCHCYLWVTNNCLRSGIEILEALGFRYVTNIAWVKDKFGLGYYFRGQHELCLFGVYGHSPPEYKKFGKDYWKQRRRRKSEDGGKVKWSGATQKTGVKTPTTVIFEKRRKHSQKPRKMYELIETVSSSPRLEMFAREKRQGWDCHGYDVPSSEQQIFQKVGGCEEETKKE